LRYRTTKGRIKKFLSKRGEGKVPSKWGRSWKNVGEKEKEK
jgi:hypothetical protein